MLFARPRLSRTDRHQSRRRNPLKARPKERYDLEARLRRSETRFRDVIERNADAIVVVDAAGAIRFLNRAAEALFGKAREELLLHPFGFPLVSGETTELELPGEGRSIRVVEMRVVESEWEDQPACLASLRDVTERKEAEESARRLIRERAARAAAERSANRMRFLADSITLLASSPDYRQALASLAALCVRDLADSAVVYGFDGDGALARLEVAHTAAGPHELATRPSEDPVSSPGFYPVHEVMRSRQTLLVRQLSPDLDERVGHDPRTLAWISALSVSSFMIVPMIARDRAVGAIWIASSRPDHLFEDDDVALIEDLAHRAALALDNAWLYAKAQEAVQAQSNLIAMVSHDLRTPLTSMLGYAELLALGIPEALGDGSLKQVERIQAAGRHLLYLIEQLTEFARLDTGKDEVRAGEVDAGALIRDVAELVEPLALDRGLTLRVESSPSAIPIETDPGKLRRILVNLAGNAVKFTESGCVVLEVQPTDTHVLFGVRDTGVGIRSEHVEKIFIPFWQVTRGDRVGGGAGLGLSIVHRLVTLLGGRVSVRSIPDQGSTFTVTLPRRYPLEQCFPTEGAAPGG